MKIFVDKLPEKCNECLLFKEISPSGKKECFFLSKSFDFSNRKRRYDCPLKELNKKEMEKIK